MVKMQFIDQLLMNLALTKETDLGKIEPFGYITFNDK